VWAARRARRSRDGRVPSADRSEATAVGNGNPINHLQRLNMGTALAQRELCSYARRGVRPHSRLAPSSPSSRPVVTSRCSRRISPRRRLLVPPARPIATSKSSHPKSPRLAPSSARDRYKPSALCHRHSGRSRLHWAGRIADSSSCPGASGGDPEREIAAAERGDSNVGFASSESPR
jgi:hypothetical protein